MRLKDAIVSLQPGKKKQRIVRRLATQWNRQTAADDREVPFSEYPRPQMERDSWINLPGRCCFIKHIYE